MRTMAIQCIVTLALSLLLIPPVGEAQPKGKVYRIGWLSLGVRPDEPSILEALRVLGYVEDHNLVVERRYAEKEEHYPALAAELVTRQVDLILTFGTTATRAAHQATSTIAIVFYLGSDPVRSGLIASYARPGGNVTGVAVGLYGDKQLAILKEAVPGIVRVACPFERHPENPDWVQFADAAQELGLELLHIAVSAPDGFNDFFAAARRAGADAVYVPNDPRFLPHLMRLGELTAQNRFPAIGFRRPFAEGGGLLSYGQKQGETIASVAAQVDKLLKGAKPADLPVLQPMRFELIINFKTAATLGLTIPPLLLFQTDEVIK
jgi:putative tryptophan/tyrosine transport system substrate-binding protein